MIAMKARKQDEHHVFVSIGQSITTIITRYNTNATIFYPYFRRNCIYRRKVIVTEAKVGIK